MGLGRIPRFVYYKVRLLLVGYFCGIVINSFPPPPLLISFFFYPTETRVFILYIRFTQRIRIDLYALDWLTTFALCPTFPRESFSVVKKETRYILQSYNISNLRNSRPTKSRW